MILDKNPFLSAKDASASNSPLVSVIIATYNQEHYIGKAIQSVLCQSFTNLECLVVDDGSSDNTSAVGRYFMSKDQRVKYFYKENGGVCSSRNFGIEHAQGEWIQFLDGDDWLHPDKIRFQLDFVKNCDSDGVVLYCDQERVYEAEGRSEIFYEYDASSKEKMLEKLLAPWGLQCGGFLLKKTVAKQAMFDTTLNFCEDCKFELDLLMQGITFIHTPIVGSFYRIHQSNTSTFSSIADSTSKIKDSYIRYLQIVQQQYGNLRQTCQQRLVDFLKRTLEQKDTERFDNILNLLDLPIMLYGLKFTKKSQLKFLQVLILYTPSVKGIYKLFRMFKRTADL
ncbi:MAG: glycosyltransferase family 2 protein [Chroococcidiopsidaceae cyanobacterium CP_BM_ER_R8_30]|nr:glycosyltransferase family 2 protein [Chroococcidiopsidaceae cyanobacterium CP_BM_ER_R8_30]